ncbi:MAG: GAF domain-containing sensor histidine kinase [Nannocystaceae bacterium]
MAAAPIPDDEPERLRALARYAVLDTAPESRFDELTALASEICGAPIALISLIDSDRQWFKSKIGLDLTQTPRELAFCAHAIVGDDDVMVVPDAQEDPRFADSPYVTGDAEIRFYAGAPLITSDGCKIGTICVLDRRPRKLTQRQLRALRILGRQVIDQLELMRTTSELARRLLVAEAQVRQQEGEGVVGFSSDGSESDAPLELRDLLANVTHDLRTPLNAILGFAEYLGEDEPIDDDERRDVAGRVREAGGYMLRLVDDILDIARIDADSVSFADKEVDLVALARSTFETIRPLAVADNNVFRLSGAPEVTLRGDPTRIRQVLLNLVSNACKYTKDGMIRTTLREDGDWIRIDVADSGIGMSAAQCRRLFRPFAQVQDGGRQGKGTGLGLHITRALCERMGGAITVDSTPDVGTTFSVWLPRARPEAPPRPPGIAVAEGGPRSRALIQRALGRVAPLTYMDGVAEVLWSMVDRRWRAVIVDADAAEADEVELVRALVRVAEEQGIPVVVTHAGEADALAVGGVRGWQLGDDLAELAARCR